MIKQVGIVIPTYNEVENISLLLKRIFSYIPEAIIVIVDDSNNEENKKLRNSINYNEKKVILISRYSKNGRGSAVIRGFKELFKIKTISYFFEMDADLAHNPKDFKQFLLGINSSKADLVIGSRYLFKSIIIKWPKRRLILSRIINVFINLLLRLKLSDYTNGFRLYNRKAVNFLLKVKLKERGFISLSEIAFKLKSNNFIIREVPITFTDRKFGESSAGINEFFWSLVGIFRIRFTKV